MLYPSRAREVKSFTKTSASSGFLFSLCVHRCLYAQICLCYVYQTALNLWPQLTLHNDQESTQKPTGNQGRTDRIWKRVLLKSYPRLQHAANCPVINATYTITCSATLETVHHLPLCTPHLQQPGNKNINQSLPKN